MADAAQLYAAFRSICPVDEEGDLLLPLEQLKDGGRGWFSIANAVDRVAAPATDTEDPYEVELVPIPPRIAPDGEEIQESEDERPTKITIRAFTAADLCVEHPDDRLNHEVFAKAMGIDVSTVEWRMDPSDVEGGIALCVQAGGRRASELCREIYFEGGGKQRLGGIPEAAWAEVAQALLTEFDGSIARVRCRTPGVGTLTIGPIKAGHIRMQQGIASRETVWMGNLAALAKASDRPLGQLLALRPEDAVHARDAFEALKKKAAERQPNTAIGARLSATFSASSKTKSTT